MHLVLYEFGHRNILQLFRNSTVNSCTALSAEVVAFAADDRYRSGKAVDFVDAYHGANRYPTSAKQMMIVLPRTTAWTFQRQRLILGRELLRMQGLGFPDDVLDSMTENQLGDMAGNAPLAMNYVGD